MVRGRLEKGSHLEEPIGKGERRRGLPVHPITIKVRPMYSPHYPVGPLNLVCLVYLVSKCLLQSSFQLNIFC
jgi:hypothetical protein